jgi:type I restriction enzyme R subunit
MGDETLKRISIDLVSTVQQSATIDWNLKDSVKAAMRAKIRRLLAKYDYPPDMEDAAVELILEQAEHYRACRLKGRLASRSRRGRALTRGFHQRP